MKSKFKFIGIDPGLSGAIAILTSDNPIILATPVIDKEIDVARIIQFLYENEVNERNSIAHIEKVGAFPKQGVVSMFRFGFVTGIMHGVFRTLKIPLFIVTPQSWKKEILVDTDKSKQAAINWCLRSYPGVNLFSTMKSKIHDNGMADALCLAEYGKRKYYSTME